MTIGEAVGVGAAVGAAVGSAVGMGAVVAKAVAMADALSEAADSASEGTVEADSAPAAVGEEPLPVQPTTLAASKTQAVHARPARQREKE